MPPMRPRSTAHPQTAAEEAEAEEEEEEEEEAPGAAAAAAATQTKPAAPAAGAAVLTDARQYLAYYWPPQPDSECRFILRFLHDDGKNADGSDGSAAQAYSSSSSSSSSASASASACAKRLRSAVPVRDICACGYPS